MKFEDSPTQGEVIEILFLVSFVKKISKYKVSWTYDAENIWCRTVRNNRTKKEREQERRSLRYNVGLAEAACW